MTEFGLCITPDFVPDIAETHRLNPAFYRSILYRLDQLEILKAQGKPLLITLNNQCEEVGSKYNRWKSSVKRLCEMSDGKVIILGCGNEFDLYWHNNNEDVPPKFAAALIQEAAEICKPYGIKVAATSVAGPQWPYYMERVADLAGSAVDYFDIHPYGQRPDGWGPKNWMHGDLVGAIETAKRITNKPIICSEYGVKIGDAGHPDEVAYFMKAAYKTLNNLDVDYCSWFAWHDHIGAPNERGEQAFGLLDTVNNKRPAWYMFQEINGGGMPIDPLLDWRGKVGDGLLAMMQEDHTEPVMASEWRPFDRSKGTAASIEQVIGKNGITYMWLLEQDKGYRIRPSVD